MTKTPAWRPALLASSLALTAAALVACGGGDDDDTPPPPTVAVGDLLALTASGRIVSFDREAPGTAVGSVTISGLAAGETLLGIDVRPADGLLYALGDAGGVYTVDPATGAATQRSVLKAAAGDDNPYAALEGSEFGVDFNPVADRLRVVSTSGQNLRINVDTGDTITDGALAGAGAPAITAAGYTNAFAGTTTTQLFVLDAAAGLLHLQDPPNDGVLGEGRPLGLTGSAANGFDIDPRDNAGYAVFGAGSSSTLLRVDLASGAATAVGPLGVDEPLRGFALVLPSAPQALGLTADNRLVAFDPKAPATLTASTPIGGLAAGETVVGIDVRPADGRLYALAAGPGGAARLYTVDPETGAATAGPALTADAADTTLPYAGLAGNRFSVDFNPVADRLRVIGDGGQNLRINVDTGATTTDGVINRAGTAPVVQAAAYTNSFAGTAATTLYDLDGTGNVLATQLPPNDGTLVDVGALGVDVSGGAAFDIAGGANGLALAAVPTPAGGPSLLYTVSLTTGAATLYGNPAADPALSRIGGDAGPALRDLAIRFR